MSEKVKFDYNKLQFVESETKLTHFIKVVVANLVAIIFIGIIVFILLSSFVKTKEERAIIWENKRLKQDYKILLQRYLKAQQILKQLQKQDELIYQALFQSKPPKEITVDYDSLFFYADLSSLIKENRKKVSDLLKKAKQENLKFADFLSKLDKQKLRYIPAVLPLPFEFIKNGIYGFGLKLDPIYKTLKIHKGIDFAAPEGTPVYATADGVVVASENKKFYGINVKISHQNGYFTLYANLSAKVVSVGQKVKRNQLIGYVGSSGKSFSPHLHYEVRYYNRVLNPLYFLFASLTPNILNEIIKENTFRAVSLD